MDISLSLGFLMAVLIGIASCQQPNDPWYNGLNSDTDEVSTNCQVASGHSDCLQQHGDVIAAVDKKARCPAIDTFVGCVKSECRNSASFTATFGKLDAYCNSALALNGATMLVFIIAVLATLLRHNVM